jgi:hypothetical protein
MGDAKAVLRNLDVNGAVRKQKVRLFVLLVEIHTNGADNVGTQLTKAE